MSDGNQQQANGSEGREDSAAVPAAPAPAESSVAGETVAAEGPTLPSLGNPADVVAVKVPESDLAASLQSLMVTVVIAVFVITFIVQAFQIPSESMENTLLIGDYLLVDKAHYGPAGAWKWLLPYRSIHRGDIVVFRYPIHPSQHFVKRVIGLPGDRVRLIRGRVYVDRQPLSEPYAVHKFRNFDDYRDNFPTGGLSPSLEAKWFLQMRKLIEDGELIVPADSYFVLGDNRDDSLDSRYWGFVPRENVIGRPLLIYWSMQRPEFDDSDEGQNGKLARFEHLVANVFQNMRWTRMMRLVH